MKLRDYQDEGVCKIRAAFASKRRVLFVCPTGGGKCLGRGTGVLLHNGKVKNVEDIIPGDVLIGPDSGKRNVLSVCSGREMLYKVTPTKGEPYIVNESHILSLRITGMGGREAHKSGNIVNISVRDYINKSKTFKHVAKGWRAPADFSGDSVLFLDPYFLGIWLGDGHSKLPAVTSMDSEIADYLVEYAKKINMTVVAREQKNNRSKIYFLIDKLFGWLYLLQFFYF
jgi:replicative DNA helicase